MSFSFDVSAPNAAGDRMRLGQSVAAGTIEADRRNDKLNLPATISPSSGVAVSVAGTGTNMQARRNGVILAVGMAAGLLLAAPALAQSALDGPLAAPDSAPPASSKAHAKAKPRKPHHAAAKAASVPAAATDAPAPRPTAAGAPAPAATPVDGIDLGTKWNGNSDTAGQTRFQNGPDNAFGSGAEVGMKLHF